MPEVTSQYRLKAAGKVIHMGTEITGKILMSFENLRIVELAELALELRMLRSDIIPPMRGRIPVGSGDVKSWNQRKPSVSIAGQITKLYDSLLISDM